MESLTECPICGGKPNACNCISWESKKHSPQVPFFSSLPLPAIIAAQNNFNDGDKCKHETLHSEVLKTAIKDLLRLPSVQKYGIVLHFLPSTSGIMGFDVSDIDPKDAEFLPSAAYVELSSDVGIDSGQLAILLNNVIISLRDDEEGTPPLALT